MTCRLTWRFLAAWLLLAPGAAAAAEPPGLSVAPDGSLRKDGRSYRGVGANQFDLLIRLLHDPNDGTSLAGLERLAKAGVPFVRFALTYSEADWRVYLDDREAFFGRFDRVVRTAERAGVGLIPSLFWDFKRFPDLVDEPRGSWGNPDSRCSALMRTVVRDVVGRYRGSPAVWAWEFGNEPNLEVDLPNAAELRGPGHSERDDLTSAAVVAMLTGFAREVRQLDAHRPIFAGHSHPRASAWHNTAERTWTPDTREQTLAVLRRDNPAPLDTLTIHLYGDRPVRTEVAAWAGDPAAYLRAVRGVAREWKRPLFVGEFGVSGSGDPAATRAGFQTLLAAMEEAGVDLAAFWVFDLKSQEGSWSVTFENSRAPVITWTAEANRRWNRAAVGGDRAP